MTTRAKEVLPFSEKLVVGVCTTFALWTLCCHSVVVAGGTISILLVVFAFAATAAGLVAFRFRARENPDEAEPPRPPPRASPPHAQQGVLALAFACAALASSFAGPVALWALLVIVLGFASWLYLWSEEPFVATPVANRNLEIGLFALATGCALYALVVHRPDADDAFYVNLAIAAIDHPDLPLLARDTLHGRFDLPIHLVSYRLHSYELANAAVARLTGIDTIQVFHWGATAVGAFLLPLAFAALFRRLTPRHWLWATLALVIVLAAPGETHRWYGNFAFVRIWQGKSIFLFVVLPLIWLAGILFGLKPDLRRWLFLAATQIAALGCTANALWAAPIAALVAMGAVLKPNLRSLRVLGIGAMASVYLIVAGLLVKSGMTASIPELGQSFAPGERFENMLTMVFGQGRLYLFGVGAIFVAWAAAPAASLARRFALIVPLAVILVLFNPFLDSFVRANITGPSYWRSAWALPAPLLLTWILISPLRLATRIGPRPVQALTAISIALFAIAIPRYSGFSERNGAWISAPALKVETGAHRWAARLNQIAPRKPVVAPPAISTWVPTFHDHAYPVEVRFYLKHLRSHIGNVAFRDRHLMTRFVDGHGDDPQAAKIFERGLARYNIEAVCLRRGATFESARAILRRVGFSKRATGPNFEIWARI